MKTILVIASLALSALAQRATIVSPTNGTTITSGTQIVVDVQQKNGLSSEVQVAAVLGLVSCPDGSCDGVDPAADGIGDILYNGLFTPGDGGHQLFTVDVPQLSSDGPAILSLTHLELLGAVRGPLLEVSGVVVNVVQ